MSTHVKAGDTKVTVEKSQEDLLKILRRYGARQFGFDESPDGKEASVSFTITHGNRNLPVQLRVEVEAVYKALYTGKPLYLRGVNREKQWREQAKRTAWRLLVDWLDAACSTTALGVQSIEEVFLAHVVVRDEHGTPTRMIEALARLQAGGALPLALPAGRDA